MHVMIYLLSLFRFFYYLHSNFSTAAFFYYYYFNVHALISPPIQIASTFTCLFQSLTFGDSPSIFPLMPQTAVKSQKHSNYTLTDPPPQKSQKSTLNVQDVI